MDERMKKVNRDDKLPQNCRCKIVRPHMRNLMRDDRVQFLISPAVPR